MQLNIVVIGVIIFAIVAIAILFAAWLVRFVLSKDRGSLAMQKVGNSIFTGAIAYLNVQYSTIAKLAIVAAVAIALLLTFIGQAKPDFDLGWKTAVSFLLGAIASGIAGYIGMYVAVQSNTRTASAATRSLGEALTVALRGGAVSAFLVVALSLLGVSSLFFVFSGGSSTNLDKIPALIVGFGFGASFVALFAQLGGGIYTKAADVGADLVGKIEAGIPEDDPRNPAVIADLVGDNVGDCAGRGADLFESTTAENIGAMILGAAIFTTTHNIGWILFPLVVSGLGILSSLIGLLTVRASSVKNPVAGSGAKADGGAIAQAQLNKGYAVTAVLALISIFTLSYFMLGGPKWYWFGIDGLVGIALSFTFVYITQYYTSGQFRPVREIAAACLTGPGTAIIQGMAVGFENTALPAIAISLALGGAYFFGTQASPNAAQTITYGIYGTAVATMGMLMSAAYILAMDTFGPITDNAGGITEMSNQPEDVRNITDALDGVGNTTKALTKGYAVGSAALAAYLLFSAYLDRLRTIDPQFSGNNAHIDLADIRVFIGALLGAMLIFLFSSLAIRAVGTTAKLMIEEVRRQFRANPKIMLGEAEPDYASCVSISTQGALRAMVLPGLLAVGLPVAVGILLGPQAAAAFLMVGTIAGILLALVMNNGGGAWDNAKKYIELGYLKDENGEVQGKKSFAHAASIVGDTVGDPFKDTAGPSLHVLIKLLSTITLVLAPIFILLQK